MKAIALVDCNNFFVSCERVFNPALKGIPVVVLSNNDGCIVARSQEAKEIGIKMGEPVFKCKKIIDYYDVKMISGNHRLYSDMSKRVMETLEQFSPSAQVHSVDEAFLDISHIERAKRLEYVNEIKETVYQWTGIPVTVGVAKTKTLSKVAGYLGKKDDVNMDLSSMPEEELNEILKNLDISYIWGIGRQSCQKLNSYGVRSAYNFKSLEPGWVRKRMGISGVRTQLELQGIPVSGIESDGDIRKSLAHTRSFKGYIREYDDLSSTISSYVSRVGEKLRREGLVGGCITVYIRTNYHRKDHKQYVGHITIPFGSFTSYTPFLLKKALNALRQVYKKGYQYKKAGVIITDIRDEQSAQMGIFDEITTNKDVMRAVDSINRRWGGLVRLATERESLNKFTHKAEGKEYTTNWANLVQVY